MDQLDAKLEFCSTLPTERIAECLPPSLLNELQSMEKCMSVPWFGLLMGSIFPVPYVLKYTSVTIESADWIEPTIIWVLMHMPSGTRKSVIYNYIQSLLTDLEDEDMVYQICESTFEKLGLIMEKNDGHLCWYFDEARHFFSQLGLYQKGSSRDESVLLSLYDGQSWGHTSAKGVSFGLPKTKLSLGGLTQKPHT